LAHNVKEKGLDLPIEYAVAIRPMKVFCRFALGFKRIRYTKRMLRYWLLVAVFCFVQGVLTAQADDLGLTTTEIKAKWGKPVSIVPTSEYGTKAVWYWYVLASGSAVYRFIDDRVAFVEYSIEQNDVVDEDDVDAFLQRVVHLGSGWQVFNATKGNGVTFAELQRAGCGKGEMIESKSKDYRILKSALWLKLKEEYEKLPWYKRFF
jgi:hypothetical protein